MAVLTGGGEGRIHTPGLQAAWSSLQLTEMGEGGVPLEGVCSFCPEAGEPRLSPTYLCRALCTLELLPDFVSVLKWEGGCRIFIPARDRFYQNPGHQATSVCLCSMPLLQSTWTQDTSGAHQVVDRHRFCPGGLKDSINITVHRVGHAQSVQQVRDADTANRLPCPARCHTG